MHEMSLVSSLHEIVDNAAHQTPFERIQTLYLTLGTLSCVDADTLRWCISTTAAGTCLEDATIVIDFESARALCSNCQTEFEPDSLMDPCPTCGRQAQRILSGRDMRVTAIDVVPQEISLSTTHTQDVRR